jgi:uncharacterized membrane protein
MKRYKTILRIISALAMVAIGAKHFTDPEPFVRIVPHFLPHPFSLVYASGFFEVLGGVGLLIPRFSRAAAWLLVVLLISVFPANLYQAIHNIPVSGLPHDPPLVWLRLPFQSVLVAWAWWFTQDDEDTIANPNGASETS